MVVRAANAFGTRPWRARAVGGIVVVGVREGARRRPRWVRISPRRGRALVSRVHGAVLGQRRQPELDFGGLGGRGGGQRVAAGRQRGRDAAGISVPARARRLSGQENAAQHGGQSVKSETLQRQIAQTKQQTRTDRAQK